MSEDDPGKLADEFEKQADELEQRNKGLAQQVQEAGTDWQRKRQDGNVPGAQPEQPEERSEAERKGEVPGEGSPGNAGRDEESGAADHGTGRGSEQ